MFRILPFVPCSRGSCEPCREHPSGFTARPDRQPTSAGPADSSGVDKTIAVGISDKAWAREPFRLQGTRGTGGKGGVGGFGRRTYSPWFTGQHTAMASGDGSFSRPGPGDLVPGVSVPLPVVIACSIQGGTGLISLVKVWLEPPLAPRSGAGSGVLLVGLPCYRSLVVCAACP